jgi:hypothetical protein
MRLKHARFSQFTIVPEPVSHAQVSINYVRRVDLMRSPKATPLEHAACPEPSCRSNLHIRSPQVRDRPSRVLTSIYPHTDGASIINN